MRRYERSRARRHLFARINYCLRYKVAARPPQHTVKVKTTSSRERKANYLSLVMILKNL